MEIKNTNLLLRTAGYTLLETTEVTGFKNYLIVNEGNKDYFNVSIAENTTIVEVENSEVFYTIKKNGKKIIKEDLNDLFPMKIINKMLPMSITESHDFQDDENDAELIDFIGDVFDNIGYKPRRIIHYDDNEGFHEFGIIIIIGGELELVLVKVTMDGIITIISNNGGTHNMGSTDNPDSVRSDIGEYLKGIESDDIIGSDEMDIEMMNEAFKLNHTFKFEKEITKIIDKKTLLEVGMIDRKTKTYRLTDDLEVVGYREISKIVEQEEVKYLLT